jgi:hypothetical protein
MTPASIDPGPWKTLSYGVVVSMATGKVYGKPAPKKVVH